MRLNKVLKALGHPTRRDIIKRLRSGALSAGDLADNYGVSKPTMSTHFAALKDADLIYGDRDGNTIHYHLNTTVADEALGLLMGLLKSDTQSESAPVTKAHMPKPQGDSS